MVEVGTVTNLARGLVSTWLVQQVNARGLMVQRVGYGVAALGLLLAVLASGGWRAFGIIILLAALGISIGVFLIKKVAVFAIGRFAQPQSLRHHRDEIDQALDRADLPTGPIAIVRFLYRLRKGPGSEARRLAGVVDELLENLDDADLDDSGLDDAEPAEPQPVDPAHADAEHADTEPTDGS